MKKAAFLLVILACTLIMTHRVHAQVLSGQQFIDSLLEELPEAKSDTAKVLILALLGNEYSSIDQEQALQKSKDALSLAKKLDWKKGMTKSLISLGTVYYKKDDFPVALNYYQQALEIAEKDSLSNLKPFALLVIGNIYTVIEEYDKALVFYKEAEGLFRGLNDKVSEANVINNIASVYINLGDYKKALQHYNTSLKMREERGAPRWLAISYDNIGYTYLKMGEYDKALKYCKNALDINKSINNKYRASENANNIASAYLEQGKYSLAIDYTHKSINYASEVDVLHKQMYGYELLGKLYKKTGNITAALNAYEMHNVLKDSLTEKRNVQEISQLRMKAEYDKKQFADSIANAQVQQLAQEKLKRQKLISFSGIAVALVLIILSTFIARERKKSDKLLLNILPSEVAKELKRRGATTAHQFNNVTVLFTDFVNFTTAGERMGSQGLVEELHSCFKAFDEIIDKYDIEKIKTIGDAYLAVCGLPTADEHHGEKIVQAAQEIRDFMQQRREQLGDKTFEVRIGIHSGSVVAGIVGVKKFAYDIWGDTVNTAARMEQNSEAGKINISQTTYELVQDKFTCTYRGELEAKNKGKLKMYFVEA